MKKFEFAGALKLVWHSVNIVEQPVSHTELDASCAPSRSISCEVFAAKQAADNHLENRSKN